MPFRIPDETRELRLREPVRFGHAAKVEKYLWKVPLRAIEATCGTGLLPDIDVMITAKRLDALYRYCAGVTNEKLTANVTLVYQTMFVDGFEPVGIEKGPEADRLSRYTICGNSWPWKYADSLQHCRIVRYKLGHLNLAVVAGVDTNLERHGDGANDMAARVSIFDPALPPNWLAWKGMYQHWLRRCPYMIGGRQQSKEVREQRVESVAKRWRKWESHSNHQAYLQSLVWMLGELRALLWNKAAGQSCIVRRADDVAGETGQVGWLNRTSTRSKFTRRKASGPLPALEVWQAEHGRYPLPAEDARKFEPSAEALAARGAREQGASKLA